MNNEELKARVGANIASLRKSRGLTQADLAERISYSDKAVSKWERAESLPDVLTLMAIARELGTDLNTLVGCAEAPASVQPEPESPEAPKKVKYTADKRTVQYLSSILVWVVALFLHMVLDAFGMKHLWMLYIVAVVANAIVLLSLRAAWKLYGWNRFFISVILWGSLTVLYLLFALCWNVRINNLFWMGLLGQAAILLWFKLFRKEETHE